LLKRALHGSVGPRLTEFSGNEVKAGEEVRLKSARGNNSFAIFVAETIGRREKPHSHEPNYDVLWREQKQWFHPAWKLNWGRNWSGISLPVKPWTAPCGGSQGGRIPLIQKPLENARGWGRRWARPSNHLDASFSYTSKKDPMWALKLGEKNRVGKQN